MVYVLRQRRRNLRALKMRMIYTAPVLTSMYSQVSTYDRLPTTGYSSSTKSDLTFSGISEKSEQSRSDYGKSAKPDISRSARKMKYFGDVSPGNDRSPILAVVIEEELNNPEYQMDPKSNYQRSPLLRLPWPREKEKLTSGGHGDMLDDNNNETPNVLHFPRGEGAWMSSC